MLTVSVARFADAPLFLLPLRTPLRAPITPAPTRPAAQALVSQSHHAIFDGPNLSRQRLHRRVALAPASHTSTRRTADPNTAGHNTEHHSTAGHNTEHHSTAGPRTCRLSMAGSRTGANSPQVAGNPTASPTRKSLRGDGNASSNSLTAHPTTNPLAADAAAPRVGKEWDGVAS